MDRLKRDLKDTQKKIDSIQSDCSHKESELAMVPNGTFKVIVRCKVCDKLIGYPSQEELDNFLKNNK